MNFDKGYIAIANKMWCETCSENKLKQVNLWIRRTSFKAIQNGSPIFFLEKGSRIVKGFGFLKIFEISTVIETWLNYKIGNGATCYNHFLQTLELPDTEKTKQYKLGNILIDNVIWSRKKIPIDHTNIPFHKAIVSGKTISKNESLELIRSIF